MTGNFAPIQKTRPLTPCTHVGRIPEALRGGQYVRNGGNPVSNDDLGREAHWFDGDGMLSGVVFECFEKDGSIQPSFVNHYILTDAFISSVTSPTLKRPIIPSIATLINPATSLVSMMWTVQRSIVLIILSHLPGSSQSIKKISVANTSVVYHDGRTLATCESGPPMRIQLPGLETVGWFNGNEAEGETCQEDKRPGFGGEGLMSFFKEWTTGHPKVDPITKEMILYHCMFAPPFVHYSVLPSTGTGTPRQLAPQTKLLNAPVPNVSGSKMMHDFGVSRQHSIIIDLPLLLNPLNLIKGIPVVSFDPSKVSRFGVFPRRNPEAIRWFETDGCCIFHTANSWDEYDTSGKPVAVNMLACRLTSAAIIFNAGNITAPTRSQKHGQSTKKLSSVTGRINHSETPFDDRLEKSAKLEHFEDVSLAADTSQPPQSPEEQCQLYYYRFLLSHASENRITHQFGLSAIPFEFPTVHPQKEMSSARYVYGCSSSTANFGSALAKTVKIDVIAKIDALRLIERAKDQTLTRVTGCVDCRSIADVLASGLEDDPIQCFKMPDGWYAQEARFVPKATSLEPDVEAREDDGYLLFYAFDESQLDADGEAPASAVSELWILDARNMKDVVCRVELPQRVPYGLHGNWFSEEMIREQRAVEKFREIPDTSKRRRGLWSRMREGLIAALG